MAYTTQDLVGLTVFAKNNTIGKLYYGTDYSLFTENSVKADDELGKVSGEETIDGELSVVVYSPNGNVNYLGTDLYLTDAFGSHIELSADGKLWEQGIIAPTLPPTDKVITPKNTGILGGVNDVIKSAGDLLKGTKKTADQGATVPTTPNSNKTVIILGIIGFSILIGGIYLLSKSPNKKQDLKAATPQADVPSPALSGLKSKK